MTARVGALCFDANDPWRLAAFWAAALGWTVEDTSSDDDDDDDEVELVPTDGTELTLVFRSGAREKAGKNRIHLDLTTSSLDDQRETVDRLIELGARHIDIGQGPDDEHVVLADPEGNELCVIEPGNSFLAGCGRLGSITCDGTPEVGRFWSEVLGWPLVWDQDEETAIRAPSGTGPFITWGPPLVEKFGKNRLHLEIDAGDPPTEVERLIALGATRLDSGAANDQREVDRVLMADPDDNEFTVVASSLRTRRPPR